MEPIYTRVEAAKLCKISTRMLDKFIESGALKVIRLNSSVRIADSDLQQLLESCKGESKSEA